ncbi:MAG: aminomethyl-transferring glycine dehydrogenase subunit GcvPA [Sulfolobales archaeon]|nr:aminomethyl-transferring glycine dehydrogenase subunit GcvPA [Sulfolobales archaeon]MDW8082273.1 aminomethyl-transferring glycine dehydrogenase subunit GcvPA [Sulfolobales archaeon]
MPHPWIPNSYVKSELMKELGISSILELFRDIPRELLLMEYPRVGYGSPLTEYQLTRVFSELMKKNTYSYKLPPFLGGGVCFHYVPSVVRHIAGRSELYTAYTPYQPEVAQGITQALFEYQSLVADLYGVDVVNASLYNGSTALAEAIRMAVRVTGRRNIVLPRSLHPEIVEVARTWSEPVGISIHLVDYDSETGRVDLSKLEDCVRKNKPAAVFIQTPNFFGIVEVELRKIFEIAHEVGSLAAVYEDPIFTGILEAPGRLGADIVIGDTSSIGSGLNFGGPSAGILGIRDPEEKLLRQLPGRLIGYTKTVSGEDWGYVMVLQTREQHIRRERATSNITTNSALEAIKAAVYLTLLGSEGLRKLGEAIAGRTEFLVEKLVDAGLELTFSRGTHLREVLFKHSKMAELRSFLKEQGIYIGPLAGRFYSELSDCGLVCVTETHSKQDIETLSNLVREFLQVRA